VELFLQILDGNTPTNGLLVKTIDKLFSSAELELSGILLGVEVLKNLE